MQSYNPLGYNQKDFPRLEKTFFEADIFAPGISDYLHEELHPFFSRLSDEQIKIYKDNFWNIYVYGVWTYLGRFKPDEIIEIAARQIPDALRLGFDVFDKLIWYMHTNVINWLETQAFFVKLKQAIIGSESMFGISEGRSYTLSEIIKQYKIIKTHKDNSLELAKFYDLLMVLLYPNGVKEDVYSYVTVDPNEVIINCINAMNLVLEMETDFLLDAIDDVTTPIPILEEALVSPGPERPISAQSATADATPPSAVPAEPAKPEEKKPAPAEKKPTAAARPPKAPEQKKPEKIDMIKVRQMINSQFKKDPAGQYEDIAGVLGKLNELAEKYKDSKISDMLYFDEQAGAFKWIS